MRTIKTVTVLIFATLGSIIMCGLFGLSIFDAIIGAVIGGIVAIMVMHTDEGESGGP